MPTQSKELICYFFKFDFPAPGFPCPTSSEWAAWVQAIGSVVAIVAAVAIAWHQRRGEVRRICEEQRRKVEDDAARARSMGLALTPVVADWGVELLKLEEQLVHGDVVFSPGMQQRVALPAALEVSRSASHQLGSAAGAFEDLIRAADRLRAQCVDAAERYDQDEPATWEGPQVLVSRIQTMGKLVAATLNAIEDLFAKRN